MSLGISSATPLPMMFMVPGLQAPDGIRCRAKLAVVVDNCMTSIGAALKTNDNIRGLGEQIGDSRPLPSSPQLAPTIAFTILIPPRLGIRNPWGSLGICLFQVRYFSICIMNKGRFTRLTCKIYPFTFVHRFAKIRKNNDTVRWVEMNSHGRAATGAPHCIRRFDL